MSNPQPLHDALERLASAADDDVVTSPMPGIRAEARRNRNRSVAITAAGIAAAVVVGYAALSAGPDASRTDDPRIVDSPTPTPSETVAIPPLEPLDTGRADVDGDGTPDSVRLMVPPGTASGDPADETWLEVRTASGTQTVQVTDATTYVGFFDAAGLADLDGNGGVEVLLFETGGGESGALSVWTWSGDQLVRATASDDAPGVLVSEAGLASGGEELGVAWQDGALFSWQVISLGSQEVNVWRWDLDDTTLTATKLPGTQCISFGALSPC